MDDAQKAVLGIVNGMHWMLDPSPPEVDRTPRSVVYNDCKIKVVRFEGGSRKYPVPVLLIPPLMVKPYVYDLRPGHSMAGHFLEKGFDVYLVDFGIPDDDDTHIGIDDYVKTYLPQAVRSMQESSRQRKVSLLGWCMGGLFALLYASSLGKEAVGNLVVIGCPVNFRKMGFISLAARSAHRQINRAMDALGNVPGILPALAMRVQSPAKTFSQYSDLFLNMWNNDYLKGYQSLNTWLNDYIPGPHDAYKEYIDKYVVGNDLKDGKVTVGGEMVDIANMTAPLLAVAGEQDEIATVGSTRDIMRLVGSEDKQFAMVPGGHVGAIVGGTAPEHTWDRMADWLEARSILPSPL